MTIVDISAPIMLGYWFVLQLFSSAISLHSINNQGGIAFAAHVGGFVIGMLVGRVFRPRMLQTDTVIEGEIVG